MESPSERLNKRFMQALRLSLVASRGGPMRGKILTVLLRTPMNPLMLARALSIDYKTALHHLDRLQKQNIVVKQGEGYGSLYHVTFTPEQRDAVEKLIANLGEVL